MDGLIVFAQDYFPFILGVHLFGVVLGFGGALISDALFLKFLKDLRIEKKELNVLKTMSKIVWVGLFILVVSGIFLFLSDIDRYSQSTKFITKMIVVGIIIVNGAVLNFVVTPKLTSVPFGKILGSRDHKMRSIRRMAFASGAVSVTSWWTAFILGLMHRSPWPFHVLFGTYLMIVGGAMLASQIFERLLSTRKIKPPAV